MTTLCHHAVWRLRMRLCVVACVTTVVCGAHRCPGLDVAGLTNPVWEASYNLRDPAVLKTDAGYVVFYTRYVGGDWGKVESWSVAAASTKDFRTFTGDRDVTAKGFASPGDPIRWKGRHILPYQSYPRNPTRLCYSASDDARTWTGPEFFLPEANKLGWNKLGRAIDPSLVVDGNTLHCFFVGSRRIKGGHANLLGHAVTRDKNLENWKILTPDKPLIGISERAPDGVENVAVFKTGKRWTMIYSEAMRTQHLAYAQSADLIHWTLKGPIDLPVQKWMAKRYGAPFVWKEPDGWVMILMGQRHDGKTTFGLLTSADGVHWPLLPERK